MCMIQDITGLELIPGDCGTYCPGNGQHQDFEGVMLECCCEECDYFMCCGESLPKLECKTCRDPYCPYGQGSGCSK